MNTEHEHGHTEDLGPIQNIRATKILIIFPCNEPLLHHSSRIHIRELDSSVPTVSKLKTVHTGFLF